jgi:hypothetical protein
MPAAPDARAMPKSSATLTVYSKCRTRLGTGLVDFDDACTTSGRIATIPPAGTRHSTADVDRAAAPHHRAVRSPVTPDADPAQGAEWGRGSRHVGGRRVLGVSPRPQRSTLPPQSVAGRVGLSGNRAQESLARVLPNDRGSAPARDLQERVTPKPPAAVAC